MTQEVIAEELGYSQSAVNKHIHGKLNGRGKCICSCWCTVFYQVKGQLSVYQEILEHFMLPCAEQLYGDADLIFQPYVAPAPLPEVPISDSVPVPDWSAKRRDLNLREE